MYLQACTFKWRRTVIIRSLQVILFLCQIHPGWLELPLARTIRGVKFHSPARIYEWRVKVLTICIVLYNLQHLGENWERLFGNFTPLTIFMVPSLFEPLSIKFPPGPRESGEVTWLTCLHIWTEAQLIYSYTIS